MRTLFFIFSILISLTSWGMSPSNPLQCEWIREYVYELEYPESEKNNVIKEFNGSDAKCSFFCDGNVLQIIVDKNGVKKVIWETEVDQVECKIDPERIGEKNYIIRMKGATSYYLVTENSANPESIQVKLFGHSKYHPADVLSVQIYDCKRM